MMYWIDRKNAVASSIIAFDASMWMCVIAHRIDGTPEHEAASDTFTLDCIDTATRTQLWNNQAYR